MRCRPRSGVGTVALRIILVGSALVAGVLAKAYRTDVRKVALILLLAPSFGIVSETDRLVIGGPRGPFAFEAIFAFPFLSFSLAFAIFAISRSPVIIQGPLAVQG